MGIVIWDKQVNISFDPERDMELSVGILTLDDNRTTRRWKGSTFATSKRGKKGLRTPRVELRKDASTANILIVIKPERRSQLLVDNKHRNICISMSGKANFSADDLYEMNLAITEARNVVENL